MEEGGGGGNGGCGYRFVYEKEVSGGSAGDGGGALPEYFERGMQVMEMAARAGKRIAEAAGQGAYEAWDEIGG